MTVSLQKFGIKIPRGYGNNDEHCWESLFIGTPCRADVVLTVECVNLHRFGMTAFSSAVGMFVDRGIC